MERKLYFLRDDPWRHNSGTNAASYNATFTPKTGYCWSDGSTGTKSVSWKIGKANPTYTAPAATAPTYNGTTNSNGTAQALLTAGGTSHGTIYYSSDNSAWSTTIPTQINAGTYTVYWKLTGDSNHNDVSSASVRATIQRKGITRVTAVSTELPYYDTPMFPTWTNYSPDTSTVSGTAAAQSVGSYSTTFTPRSNFQWAGGSNPTDAITIAWNVYQARIFSVTVPATLPVSVLADGTVTVSEDAAIVNHSTESIRVTGMVINPSDGWTMESVGRVKDYPVNSKVFALDVKTEENAGIANQILAPEDSLGLRYHAEVTAQTTDIEKEPVARVVFTVAWADEDV